jgi:hypothetical protein
VSIHVPHVTPEALATIRLANQQRLAGFQAQGVAVNIPSAPAPLVEMLIEAVAGGPEGSPEWLAFLHAYEVRIEAMLDQVESQIARAKLTAPGPVPNGSALGLPRDLRG